MLVLVLCLACRTDGHGKLTSPTPRVGTAIGDGAKLTRGSARDVNCGGTENGDPGFTLPGNQPKIAYTVGANVGIVWDLKIQGWWANVRTLLLDYTQEMGPTLAPKPLLARSNTSTGTGVRTVLERC